MIAYKEAVDMPALPVKHLVVPGSNRDPITVHPHWHHIVEILHMNHGCMLCTIDGTVFRIAEGQTAIIGQNQFHSVYSEKSCEVDVFQIDLSAFLSIGAESGLLADINNLHFSGTVNANDVIHPILCEIRRCMNDKHYGYSLDISKFVLELIAELLYNKEKYGASVSPGTSGNNKKIAAQLFEFVEKNYADNIYLPDASNYVNLSVPHFSRVCKAITGTSFHQFLINYRISKSITCLLSGDNVTEAAAKCGYNDVNIYIRNFKKVKGVTPSEYKKQM